MKLLKVRELSGNFKMSGKYWHLAKVIKNVMEFHTMWEKMTILDNKTLQSLRISTN